MFYQIEHKFQITDFFFAVLDRRFPENFNFSGEKHDFWEIVYVLDGKLEVTEDEKVYIMSERDILFHAPNEFHRVRSAENTTPRVINVSFRADGVLPQHLENGVIHLSSVLHSEYMEIVEMLKRCESQRANNEATDFFEASCRMSAFLLRLIREGYAKDNFSTSAGAKAYSFLVEMMHRETCSNLSLEEFAKKCFVSVSYIKKLFNHYIGISPKRYYIGLRVAEAQRLLLTDIPISEIAEKMNFSSASYFTLFFKEQTGYTPIQYRRVHSTQQTTMRGTPKN